MDFQNQSTGKITATVELNYCIDVVFPETIFRTKIDRTGIVFCHESKVVYSFVDKGSLRQREFEISTDGRTIKMMYILLVINIGNMHS